MRRRRDGGVRGQDGVGKLEKRIGTSVRALVGRSAKDVQEIGMFHNDPLCRRGRRTATLRNRLPSSLLKRNSAPWPLLGHPEAMKMNPSP
jgi:hypothetical protein